MKNEKLFQSIGKIDDNLIDRSEHIPAVNVSAKRRMNMKAISAACLAICILSVTIYLIIDNFLERDITVPPVTHQDSNQDVIVNDKDKYIPANPSPETIETHTSFLRGYDNIAALAVNSNKIAVVRVLDDGECQKIETGSPCTINQIEVLQPIYNCEKGDVVEHLTPGGLYEGKLYITNDVEQLIKGREYLLFMRDVGYNRYMELNYDHGRFFYENGKVTHVRYNQKYVGGLWGMKDYDLEVVLETVELAFKLPVPDGEIRLEYQSWDLPVEPYDSWNSLFKDSDAVCTVTIESYKKSWEEGTDSSYFTASVDQVFHGNPGDSISLVTYNSLYGENEEYLDEYIDDPWMNKGEKYLVFLSRDDKTGMYHCIGRSQGRFALKDGMLTSLGVLYPNRIKMGLDVENLLFEIWEKKVLTPLKLSR